MNSKGSREDPQKAEGRPTPNTVTRLTQRRKKATRCGSPREREAVGYRDGERERERASATQPERKRNSRTIEKG